MRRSCGSSPRVFGMLPAPRNSSRARMSPIPRARSARVRASPLERQHTSQRKEHRHCSPSEQAVGDLEGCALIRPVHCQHRVGRIEHLGAWGGRSGLTYPAIPKYSGSPGRPSVPIPFRPRQKLAPSFDRIRPFLFRAVLPIDPLSRDQCNPSTKQLTKVIEQQPPQAILGRALLPHRTS